MLHLFSPHTGEFKHDYKASLKKKKNILDWYF